MISRAVLPSRSGLSSGRRRNWKIAAAAHRSKQSLHPSSAAVEWSSGLTARGHKSECAPPSDADLRTYRSIGVQLVCLAEKGIDCDRLAVIRLAGGAAHQLDIDQADGLARLLQPTDSHRSGRTDR